MRIVAKKKDYYDCIQATGQDRSLVYVRDEETINLKPGQYAFPYFHIWGYNRNFVVHNHAIGFCGEVHLCLETVKCTYGGTNPTAFCYNMQEVEDFFQRHMTNQEREFYEGRADGRAWRRTGHTFNYTRHHFREWWENNRRTKTAHKGLFEAKRCPVFTASWFDHHGEFIWNGLLSRFHFYRIVPPYQAFQSITQWLSNQAQPEKKMPVIPDEMKIATHGFDRYSFRQPKAGDLPKTSDKKKD